MPEFTKQKHLLSSSCLLQHSVLKTSAKMKRKRHAQNEQNRYIGKLDSIYHFNFVYIIFTLAEFFTMNLSSPKNNVCLRYLRSRKQTFAIYSGLAIGFSIYVRNQIFFYQETNSLDEWEVIIRGRKYSSLEPRLSLHTKKKKANQLLCCTLTNVFLQQLSWFTILFSRKGIKLAILTLDKALHFTKLEEISILLNLTFYISSFLRRRKLQCSVSYHIFVADWS